jgi:hypothetical protein
MGDGDTARRNQLHDSHKITKRESKILQEDTMKLIAERVEPDRKSGAP